MGALKRSSSLPKNFSKNERDRGCIGLEDETCCDGQQAKDDAGAGEVGKGTAGVGRGWRGDCVDGSVTTVVACRGSTTTSSVRWGEVGNCSKTGLGSSGLGNDGSICLEGSVTCGGGVDGTVHATLAMWWATAEEPDGSGGLGYFEGVDTDLSGSGIKRNEWRGEAILLRNGVELLCARNSERALGNGVVSTAELEVDQVTDLGGHDLREKEESFFTSLVLTNLDGDVGGGGGGSEGGDGGGGCGELHDVGQVRVDSSID
jgi:hypothetical protein